ncbi:MAG: SusC/RagA family TonB-linked outer membrane protein [Muribaculaceae bacterium]|nr:SusC/RagA family TonB-linked outer membrane protein [Muribaculaceae bacterium]
MKTFLRLIASVMAITICTVWAMAQSDSTAIVGYAKGGTSAGSVETITEGDMNRDQVSTALDAINGRVAGLTITRSDNGVAALNAVRVRGTTSLTGGNDPLIIIDGVMGDLTTLSSIYPADIESFTILKDASETAQYGSRGASGVIEVVTKKGSAGKASISYNGSYGFCKVFKNLNMLNASDYVSQVKARGLMLIDHGFDTNWQKAIEQTAFLQDHHIAFAGGGKDNGYRVSLGYVDHAGVILHEKSRNFISNMSMYQSMWDGLLKIDLGMFGNLQKNKTSIYDVQKTFYSAATFNPTFEAAKNASGGYDGFAYSNQINHPMALMDSRTNDNTTHISTHAKLSFRLAQGLDLSFFGAYSHTEIERQQYLPTSIWAHGQAYRSTAKNEQLLGNIVLTYDMAHEKHHLNALALAEAERDKYNGFFTTTTNFNNDAVGFDAIQAGALTLWEGTGSYSSAPSLVAFMGRVSYDYDNRYSLTVTARTDGSSKFGDNHKWGFFPSISASWTLSHEQFLRNLAWLDNLKLRAGYGLAGNQGGIDSYSSAAYAQPAGIAPVGNAALVAFATLRNVNPDLKWEVKRTFNVGIDASFLAGRLFTSIDYYTSRTSDMLYNYGVPVPPFTYSSLLANIGKMSNSGLEISLGTTPFKTGDMELNVNVNLAFPRNKLISLSGKYKDYYINADDYVVISNLNGAGFHGGDNNIVYQIVGQPLGVFYLPHCTGLKTNDDGTYTYGIDDLDGDGIIDLENGKDRRICGQATPKALLGTNLSFRYKNFDVVMQINGAFGHKIFNGTSLTYMNLNSLPGYNVLDKAPEMRIYDQTATDYWLENGNYLNLDYLTVGWNVPVKSKIISRLRLSITVNNLATITGYSGLTPIINSNNINSTLGVDDKRNYPLARNYTLGLNISF